jgi:flagellar hook-basal body complex protein FliE
MDGLTIKSGQNFLEAGGIRDNTRITGNSNQSTNDSRSVGGVGGASFSDTLNQAIGQVNSLQKASDKAAQDLSTGRTDNVADVMIASEKADIALRLMMQVRNKIIDAYQEIMKMQV